MVVPEVAVAVLRSPAERALFADGGFCRVAQTCSVQVTSFPKGVTRGIPLSSAVTHHLLKTAQQGSRALAPGKENYDRTADLCHVSCVPIGRRAINAPCAHPRERSSPQLALERVLETALEITAPCSFRCSSHVFEFPCPFPGYSLTSSSRFVRAETSPFKRSP